MDGFVNEVKKGRLQALYAIRDMLSVAINEDMVGDLPKAMHELRMTLAEISSLEVDSEDDTVINLAERARAKREAAKGA